MLDIVILQHIHTGINLVEYRHEETNLNPKHSSVFSAFLSAIQAMTKELEIGNISLISTEGDNEHNCIIVTNEPVCLILIVDHNDSIKLWKYTGNRILDVFFKIYGKEFDPHEISEFKDFYVILKEMCNVHKESPY